MRADRDANDRTVVERRDPLVGTTLDDRFRIDFQLAAGGFGAIYRATDIMADAPVALKVLHPQLARDQAVVTRFRREGATLAKLRDPHTITAYEPGEAPDGTLYIVMELLQGESLYERFRSGGPLAWQRVVHIALGVCSSLAEAHGMGIVHRDLKPANIHLESVGNDNDFVKVLDFGIAKIVHGGGGERNDLTQTGQMIGTVDYMSPEQMVGGELTGRSDIYTLGVVMYEMITGRTPFGAQSATAILAAVLTQTPDPMSRHTQVPALLDQIVARCLEREAENRFADVTELVEALHTLTRQVVRAEPRQVIPATGFEPALSAEATRIDVRRSESSQPVIDARGPRQWPIAVAATPPQPHPTAPPQPYATPTPQSYATPTQTAFGTPVPPGRARGSQNAIDARRFQAAPDARVAQPMPDGRNSQPVIDLAAWQNASAQPPVRAAAYPAQRYDMAAAADRDALVRRIIWIALILVAVAAVLILK